MPQIDIWGPGSRQSSGIGGDVELPDQLSYRDAMAFMKAHKGVRQTAMYGLEPDVTPDAGQAIPSFGPCDICGLLSDV